MKDLLKRIFTFLVLFAGMTLSAEAALTKQEQWNIMSNNVNHWADGLNWPIDAGIKETVTILNLYGFTTRQSCQGHPHQGTRAPWVDFSFRNDPYVKKLDDRMGAISDHLRTVFAELQKKHPELSYKEIYDLKEYQEAKKTIDPQWTLLCKKVDKAQKPLLKPLQALLDKFYRKNPCHDDRRLCLGFNVLHSKGSEGFKNLPEKQIVKKLEVYQKEMWEFTRFLKKRFMANEKTTHLSKKEKWERMSMQLDVLEVCSAGCDADIKDGAIALTLLGFPVSYVNDGKIGRVSLCIEFRKKFKNLYHRLDILSTDLEYAEYSLATYKKLSGEALRAARDALPEWKSLQAQQGVILKAEAPYLQPLEKVLRKFYKKYPCSDDRKLVVSHGRYIENDICNSKKPLNQWTEEDRKQKFELYKQEMKKFGRALKAYYFSSKVK